MIMHRCLSVTEIVSIICAELSAEDTANGHRCLGSLAALARTCRAMQEPALDALWAELSTLWPLLMNMDTSESNIWGTYPKLVMIFRTPVVLYI